MPVVGFRVDEETYKILQEKAREQGITVSDLLRLAVEKCLNIEVNTSSNERSTEEIKKLQERLERLERRLEELERQLRRKAGSRGLDSWVHR